MKIGYSGVQLKKSLRPPDLTKTKLLSLLTSCGTVRLFDQVVAACRGNHLLVVDIDEALDLPDRRAIAPQLIRVDYLWDVIFTQHSDQEASRRFGIVVPLE